MKNIFSTIAVGLCLSASEACADVSTQPLFYRTADMPAVSDTTAVSTAVFLSSLGVNTHVDQGYNPQNYVEPLNYLGVRNLRDSPRNLSGYLMLHQKAGVYVDLISEDVTNTIAAAKQLETAGALLAIEGPNEPNNFAVTYNGQTGGAQSSWMPVAQLQKDLYSAVKSDPQLKTYPVFSVSEAGAESDNVGLQFLTIPEGAGTMLPTKTAYADYANPHNYVSGNWIGYVDNQAWQAADPTLNSYWDGLYVEYGKTWCRHFQGYTPNQLMTLPRVTTETGWDTVSNPGGERVQGVVLVNTYLAQFKRGWRYTFIYELGEGEGGGGHQGLFHQDWSPKLAATYIHNLTTILGDTVPLAKPDKLNYSVVNEPLTVHDLLLEKSNSVFDLVIWGEQATGSRNITVSFGQQHSTVEVFDTTIGTDPIQTYKNVSQIPLQMTDHAMILQFQ